jgi:sulfonate dioxygenase
LVDNPFIFFIHNSPSSAEHTDAGSRADKAKPHLLQNAKVRDLNPYIGTVIKGVQISQLGKEGLDELALYAAERKLLVFRNQDFKDISPERQIEIVRYGRSMLCDVIGQIP